MSQPNCISLILCDEAYRDERTKKILLLGVFNNIAARELPCRHHKLTVFFSLTDGHGSIDLGIKIEHEQSGSEIISVSKPYTFNNPLQIVDIHLEFVALQFPAVGKYWLQVLSDGRIINQRPFYVSRLQPQPQTPPPADQPPQP